MMPAIVEAAIKTVLSLVLAGLAAAYVCAWRQLRAAGHAPPLRRLALYALGLAAIAGPPAARWSATNGC